MILETFRLWRDWDKHGASFASFDREHGFNSCSAANTAGGVGA